MSRNKGGYGKRSFLNKVRISVGVLIIVPVLLLECFMLYSSTRFIKEQQSLEAKETIERNYQDLKNKMTACEKSLTYLVSNRTLIDFMTLSDNQYVEINAASKNISSLIYNTLLSNSYFKKIQVYSNKNIAVNHDIFKNVEEAGNQTWYNEMLEENQTVWQYDGEQYYVARRISTALPERTYGAIQIQVKEELFRDGMSMFAQIPTAVQLQEEGRIVAEYDNYDKREEAAGMEVVRGLNDSGWSVCYRVDKGYFSDIWHPQILLSFGVVVVLLIIELVALNYSTKRLLKYLYRLIHDVKQVKDHNFQIYVDESCQDEIGELARSVNQMLRKIQILIEEVYKSKLEQKSLELEVLQAKINPHFLYNNLSAINWIAIEKGEDKIYQITTELAAFYRTALNKGKNVDDLSVEISNIRSYLKLQLIAHEDSFQVEYEIAENLLKEKIPIFIMQPLVENAIEHGVDTLRDTPGRICIRVKDQRESETEGECILIEIQDNGKELYQAIGENWLPKSSYGYGLGNVHKRVQLLCGEKYGVGIYADQHGTTSQIRIRKKLLVLESEY